MISFPKISNFPSSDCGVLCLVCDDIVMLERMFDVLSFLFLCVGGCGHRRCFFFEVFFIYVRRGASPPSTTSTSVCVCRAAVWLFPLNLQSIDN